MSILIGFKRAKIQPFDADGSPYGDLITIEGTQDEGATLEANISGLSSDPVKKYGSNVAYYISQKGTGDVSVDFSALDMPYAAEARILGYIIDTALKAQFVGESTEPPYCALILESEDNQGNVALFGFFKGKFSRSNLALKTKEAGNFDPEGDAFTYSAIASDRAGKAKGNTMVRFLGSSNDAAAIESFVLTGVAGAISIPSVFPTIPFKFFSDIDGEIEHNFTFDQFKDGYEEIYASGSAGSDSTGDGSASKPFASIQKAIDLAESGAGDSYIIKVSDTLFTRNHTATTKTITKNISIVGTGDEKTFISTAVEQLTWTQDGEGTWKATRNGVYAVFDRETKDTHGEPTPYDNMLTLAECQAQAGSWYTDDTTIWIHTKSGNSPTIATHAVCLNQNLMKITVTNDATLYFENIRYVAGRASNGVNILGDGNIQGTLITNNCSFLGSNLRNEGSKLGNALSVESVKNVFNFNSVAAYSGRDGFNYHYETLWANASTKGRTRECVVVEYNCLSYSHGLYSESGADNASTCHEGACIIRVGCTGHDTAGPVIHDAMGCLSYIVDCHMQDSELESGDKKSAYYFDNDSAVENGKAWLINSSGSGDNYSLNAVDGFELVLSNFTGDNIPTGLNITYLD